MICSRLTPAKFCQELDSIGFSLSVFEVIRIKRYCQKRRITDNRVAQGMQGPEP